MPDGPADERFLYLSDILPTAWQAVEYAVIPNGGSVTVFGLGPVGQFCARIARHRGARVIAVDPVLERAEMARRHGIEVLDPVALDDVPESVRELTGGRGTDSVIDAVGMEAHGSHSAAMAQKLAGLLPDSAARKAMEKAGVDRLQAPTQSIETGAHPWSRQHPHRRRNRRGGFGGGWSLGLLFYSAPLRQNHTSGRLIHRR